jgi:glycosyltransferase involved in cell wall biosynthesis
VNKELTSGQPQREGQPIAFVLGSLTVGGSETKIVRLANRLAEQGYQMHLLVIGPPYTLRDQIDSNVAVSCFDRKSKFSIRIVRQIRDYLSDHSISTILCVNPYSLVYGWPVKLLCRRKEFRLISAINTSELVSFRDGLFMIIYGFILRRCDVVIFGCEKQRESWIRRYRIAKQRSRVIYNGVDTQFFYSKQVDSEVTRQSLSISPESSVIGCVAQFRPEKRHVNLLEALRKLIKEHGIDAVLILVGDGPEETALRQFVEKNDLSGHVRFAGRVRDIRPYLRVFDVSVMPSVAVEVFSNALLESIAMGVPVISSDVGGSSEMIEHGEEGYIYHRTDVTQLTDYLRQLITDRGLANRFRSRARDRLEREFTTKQMDRDYIDVFWGSQ